jgi:hypothetical protein
MKAKYHLFSPVRRLGRISESNIRTPGSWTGKYGTHAGDRPALKLPAPDRPPCNPGPRRAPNARRKTTQSPTEGPPRFHQCHRHRPCVSANTRRCPPPAADARHGATPAPGGARRSAKNGTYPRYVPTGHRWPRANQLWESRWFSFAQNTAGQKGEPPPASGGWSNNLTHACFARLKLWSATSQPVRNRQSKPKHIITGLLNCVHILCIRYLRLLNPTHITRGRI